MVVSKLLKLCYAVTVLYGSVTALSPKRSLAVSLRCWYCGFENVSELEPKPWYVRATRAVGVGMIAAGVAGFVLEDRARVIEPGEGKNESLESTETGDVDT
ncbi:hypothetical protein [Natronobacterium texcoconense]|uniref:DUF6199 domain-containing protein n=1 Tax=Natronobacterium texcoconense TaxID=1095778 RepID=A0A1H0ZR17_NATTX|nr:hypothetical protein [Natronobacterium texcoconense]SDQ29935.1 hypothetical protein SAMN04489842_0400 [Natronobacterium texcoconense]